MVVDRIADWKQWRFVVSRIYNCKYDAEKDEAAESCADNGRGVAVVGVKGSVEGGGVGGGGGGGGGCCSSI